MGCCLSKRKKKVNQKNNGDAALLAMGDDLEEPPKKLIAPSATPPLAQAIGDAPTGNNDVVATFVSTSKVSVESNLITVPSGEGETLYPLTLSLSDQNVVPEVPPKEKSKKSLVLPPEIIEPSEPPRDELAWVEIIPTPPTPDSLPYYITSPVEELHKILFVNVFQMLMEDGIFFNSREARAQPPFQYRGPEELKDEMDFALGDCGVSHQSLLQLIQGVIKFQPHVSHPFFMEQSVAGLEPYSCISELVASCLNSNNVLYIVSTALTILELELIRAVCKLVGYDEDGNGDGAITPGAGLANGYAMRMAAKQKLPMIKTKGLSGSKRPIIFVSERSAYLQSKCAIFQGFGKDSVVSVNVDERGRMDISDLKAKILASLSESCIPCMVVGTAGTNIVRAIDPLDKIADICDELGLWFHVDATWGGGLLLSPILKEKLKGIERSDSFTWSQHFVLSVPCTSTCIVTPPRHKDKLTSYLGLGTGLGNGNAFTKTPLYNPKYDIGHNTLLSCRRPEMFKFWLMWKAKGSHGMGRHMDFIFRNAQFCLEEMKRREGFQPILDEFEGTNICFLYLPLRYRAIIQNSKLYTESISKLSLALRRTLLVHGIVSLSYNELPGKPTFLILGLHNSVVTKADIVYVLDQIEHVGEVLGNPKHERHHHYTTKAGITPEEFAPPP